LLQIKTGQGGFVKFISVVIRLYLLKGMIVGKNKKVYVALSGGVDSSVAALLLRDWGYDVIGVFMRCYNLDGCAELDAADARRVAAHLDIPFYVWDFEDEYKKRVVDYMVEGYRRGQTPNPDVMCNKEIKFGLFLKKALALGADYVATGHYVRRVPANLQKNHFVDSDKFVVSHRLYQAKDQNKDQSYFLWTLKPEQIARCLFPIGDYLKSEVREMAKKAGLPTAEKKDSQGICFLGKVTLADFLKNYIPARRGAVLNTAGKKVGEHEGAEFYTIGQRHLGIKNYESGIRGRHETPPVYVAEKNVETNTVVVAEGRENPAWYRKEVKLTDVNFINPVIHNSESVMARVRYRQPLAEARIINDESGIRLIFEKPQKFVASGQSAVFYSLEGEMLGGGVII